MVSSARAVACVLELLGKRIPTFTLLQILFLANREYKTVWGKNLLSDFYESDDYLDTLTVLPDLTLHISKCGETCCYSDFAPQERICKTNSSYRHLKNAALNYR